VIDEDAKPGKKDTSTNQGNEKKKSENKPIGAPSDEPKKKKGFLKKIFGKKEEQ
jgi:hypothetical protein